MATRLSLRRVGDSTGKLIAAPDSVASRWPSTPPSSGVVVVALGLDIADLFGSVCVWDPSGSLES